jgi:phosphoesterase RecJ-like protein
MDQIPRNRIADLLRAARSILLVTHVAPDGDAIGSLLGLGWLLRGLGKEPILACEDPSPSSVSWLPGSVDIVQQAEGPCDLVICLDCSDERRMGNVLGERFSGTPLINIDHHVTNTRFGTVNWVDPSSASTAQMVLMLAESMGWEVTPTVAECLLTGLVTDTRGFRTYNVDAGAMRAALRLMDAGATLNEITRRTLEQRPLASVRLWGQAFDRIQLEGGIMWTEVTRDMQQRWFNGENGDSGLANFLSGVRESSIVVVFTERGDGTIDVGMRSVPGFDVATVACRLGGGGHPQAAGCTLPGPLAEVQGRVLDEIQQSLALSDTHHSQLL